MFEQKTEGWTASRAEAGRRAFQREGGQQVRGPGGGVPKQHGGLVGVAGDAEEEVGRATGNLGSVLCFLGCHVWFCTGSCVGFTHDMHGCAPSTWRVGAE